MFLLLNFIVLKLRTYNLKQNDKNVLFINKQVCLYCSQVAYNKKKIPYRQREFDDTFALHPAPVLRYFQVDFQTLSYSTPKIWSVQVAN